MFMLPLIMGNCPKFNICNWESALFSQVTRHEFFFNHYLPGCAAFSFVHFLVLHNQKAFCLFRNRFLLLDMTDKLLLIMQIILPPKSEAT
jgi:hypothetical protein